jgi:hypothetical protein
MVIIVSILLPNETVEKSPFLLFFGKSHIVKSNGYKQEKPAF